MNNAIWTFEYPSEESTDRIRDLCLSLPCINGAELRRLRRERGGEAGETSELGRLIEAIEAWLTADNGENEAERDHVPWRATHMLELMGPNGEALFVGTRLEAPDGDEGAIIYGCLICRTMVDSYTYWIDPEDAD